MRLALARDEIQNLASCYATEVLTQRHRIVALRGRKCKASVMYTLLGFEVKAGRKRITCPDLATANYLRLFAEIGMPAVRIPYDPTLTARLLPRLEQALEAIQRRVTSKSVEPDVQLRLVRQAYGALRRELLRSEQLEATGPVLSRRSP